MRTIADVIARLPRPSCAVLPAPAYKPLGLPGDNKGIALAVSSMARHMTDEGFQLTAGLEHAGYKLYGHGYPNGETDTWRILSKEPCGVVFVQDKREWEGLTADGNRDPVMRFKNIEELARRPDLFKVTVLKDAQARPDYHRQSAEEIGCHAWVVYYHLKVVKHVAPYVRMQHLIRTYHSINAAIVPDFNPDEKKGCLLSGAISGAYPLRTRLFRHAVKLPDCTVLRHPGYHRNGCATPIYLQTLSRHKIAIATSSVYGYALRKIIEAVACGCVVITDLPQDDVLPEIDDGLVRISNDAQPHEVALLLKRLYAEYNPQRQRELAAKATRYYDYRAAGLRLAADIERMRKSYNANAQ